MKNYGFPDSYGQEGLPIQNYHHRDNFPANFRSYKQPVNSDRSKFHCQNGFSQNRQKPLNDFRPNFTIQLRLNSNDDTCNNRRLFENQVHRLVDRCTPKPDYKYFFPAKFVSATLQYQQWKDTKDAMVYLWDQRLQGSHLLNPNLISNVTVPSDKDELRNSLKTLFENHVKGLLDGEVVKTWTTKIELLSKEIGSIDLMLSRRGGVKLFQFSVMQKKKEGLVTELQLIEKRLEEFKIALNCVLSHIDGSQYCMPLDDEVKVNVLRFPGELVWDQIHFVILRECRRLDDGLPIYSCRREILKMIHNQQAMVLIGETGSGKSTQLVQFLADSGLADAGSVICTQPRKIAAISLAQRVREESNGCYKNNPVTCYPSFSSAQGFKTKVVFMTDHCLLQHYMNDRTLAGVSYIIVDEAHERSLNTDLLLALLKGLLLERLNVRLIIMSATADACKLSDYFFGCGTYHVVGRNFPVEIKYVPTACGESNAIWGPHIGNCAPYVSDVVKTVTEINRTEKEGAILAFLTSQTEVEWACEKLNAPSAVALPLHGKLSSEEQGKVFKNYKERKIIFATNLAETSLTIPGVKYVVDCGLVKDSRFEPSTGMNVLRVCRISQSSAEQRAGRAGRTEPGKCYRLYSEEEFQSMPFHQDPEIRKVHLGIAVLRIIALGIKNVRDFDFIDAPSPKAIDMAIENLIHLGAIICKNGAFEFTEDGRYLVKLGIEPRLGKLILESLHYRLGKEGLVLAAVMANSSSIFYRVGNDEDKLKSDCLKVPFCHRDGDLFTLLSVYKEWENVPTANQSKWCVNNSVNAKSMRRCRETVDELEHCLKNELASIIPNYWRWNPDVPTAHDKNLKKVILSSLAENVAMYSGHDRLGYQVGLSRQYVQLHPSSSLLIYSQRPSWVVFGDILSISSQYLVCVTAIDHDCLYTLPPSLLDVSEMEKQRLLANVMTGFGTILLKRLCGRANSSLFSLISRVQSACMDERIGIEVDVDKNEIQLFASSENLEKVTTLVNDAMQYEAKWLRDECTEKYLYRGGPGITPSLALIGAGGEIKHLELQNRYLTVEVSHSNVRALDDKELLVMFEKRVSSISSIHRHSSIGHDCEDSEKWGKITFLTPEAAEKAVTEMNGVEVKGSLLKVFPSRITTGGERFTFPAVRVKVCWPRRSSKGFAFVKCAREDLYTIVSNCSGLVIRGRPIHCEISKNEDCVLVHGIDREISDPELFDILRTATYRKIFDIHLVRGEAVNIPSYAACEEALAREIAPLIPSKNSLAKNFHVQVFPPEAKDYMMRAVITFDGRLHLEAAMALDHIQGKVLPGCRSWQKIQCQHMFHSSVFCPSFVYPVVKRQLESLFKHQNGGSYILERNENGSYRVKISANATKTVADMRRPLEQILSGKNINHDSLTPSILQLVFSRDGIKLLKSLQMETGTFIMYDKHKLNVRIFGPEEKVSVAEKRLVQSLLLLNENKQHEIRLRGKGLPYNLMKEVVKKFGSDLHGLKEKAPDAELFLNIRRHSLLFRGHKELRQKVEEMISVVAKSLSDNGLSEMPEGEVACPICLCELEDCYQLEACRHSFCRSCLVDQCDSAIKSHEGFPLRCTHDGCGIPILLADLRSLLTPEKLEDLFRASLGAFVALSGGVYRFCPSPDCPALYRVAPPGMDGMVAEPFVCGACHVETCTSCHLEYHPYMKCERYKQFKEDPDHKSLKDWCKGKEEVKCCPACGHTIEKYEGCNHVECKCGNHICWVCLDCFVTSGDCYNHLGTEHPAVNLEAY
ncbi:Atp-dependent rna helicase deah11 protein [Thalictrum thalictroides]|uniref:RNA helicase n=1 Tax=Thalictrum thalictroides TaxID=46969 RepID=A0A7J6VU43_THATH|nr:Atp-dependent rna helicase deah11 protein [Thalictrum thalictroides]